MRSCLRLHRAAWLLAFLPLMAFSCPGVNPLPGRPRYQPTELTNIGDNITYDNGSTYNQIAALATIYSVTKLDKYRTAMQVGLRPGASNMMKCIYSRPGRANLSPLLSAMERVRAW